MRSIRLKIPTITENSSGGSDVTYSPDNWILDWAEIKNLNERLEVIALQEVEGTMREFKIRWRPSLEITDKWLISYDGQDHKIQTISRVEEKHFYIKVIAKTIQ